MGCGDSKHEEAAAVAHCRDRSLLLADAIRHRYALADAHAAYSRSLEAVGNALVAFLAGASALPPSSPELPLRSHQKSDNLPFLPSSAALLYCSGSHIDFRPSSSESDGDGDDEDDASTLQSERVSPVCDLHADTDYVGPTYANLNHSRSCPAEAPVAYEQQLPSVNHCFLQSYPSVSLNIYPYPAYPYSSYGDGMDGDSFDFSFPTPSIPAVARTAVRGSPTTSLEVLPPSSPPRTSTWDFLNPFDYYYSVYNQYCLRQSSIDLREEKEIPDVENVRQEVKETHSDLKFVDSSSPAAKGELTAEVGSLKEVEEVHNRKSRSLEVGSGSEQRVYVKEKSLVTEPEDQSKAVAFTYSRSYRDISKVVQEIKTQFDRASESAGQMAKMLEVGKFSYHEKNYVYKVSAKVISSLPALLTSKNEGILVFEEDKATGCGNLSSTLQKLHNWEKKLIEELMAEEKMRVSYHRKCEQLKRLSEGGAEAEKLEAVEASIRELCTNIRIAIQVVGTISSEISQLRDEELLPEIIELIKGFRQMWTLMLKSHHIQFQAISEAKCLYSTVNEVKQDDFNMDALKQLEMSMVDWIANFSAWVNAQRSYAKSLNGWLLKGIHCVPEVTDDGILPFSPDRLGAPPIFAICNYWSKSMDMVCERDVAHAMLYFANNVFSIWQRHSLEQKQRLMVNGDTDVSLRLMERDEQLMLKNQNKLLSISAESCISIPGHLVHHGFSVDSLHLSLRQMFEAMEKFAVSSVKAYEVPCMNQEYREIEVP